MPKARAFEKQLWFLSSYNLFEDHDVYYSEERTIFYAIQVVLQQGKRKNTG